jgi:5'-nucleotidase
MMPLLLITNDDGFDSTGITALYEAVKDMSDAYIVAPDRERSASGHSLTIHKPLRVTRVEEHVYRVSGTPTDCIAVGVEKVLPKRPDLIISGINHGPNLGDDITYSGTVSAAIEGTILNIPSFAISLDIKNEERAHFETAAEIAVKVAQNILDKSLPYDTLLNVNVPNTGRGGIRGMKITRQGRRVYDGAIRETRSPWGEVYYWIGGGTPYWEHSEDTDIHAVLNDYVSLSPLHLDLTNHSSMDFLKKQWKTLIS